MVLSIIILRLLAAISLAVCTIQNAILSVLQMVVLPAEVTEIVFLEFNQPQKR